MTDKQSDKDERELIHKALAHYGVDQENIERILRSIVRPESEEDVVSNDDKPSAQELAATVLGKPSPAWEGYQWIQAATLLAREVQAQRPPIAATGETPRTDAVWNNGESVDLDLLQHARQLERELAEAMEQSEHWRDLYNVACNDREAVRAHLSAMGPIEKAEEFWNLWHTTEISADEVLCLIATHFQWRLPPKDLSARTETAPTHCSQCGQPFSARACGPTHALIASERAEEPQRRKP